MTTAAYRWSWHVVGKSIFESGQVFARDARGALARVLSEPLEGGGCRGERLSMTPEILQRASCEERDEFELEADGLYLSLCVANPKALAHTPPSAMHQKAVATFAASHCRAGGAKPFLSGPRHLA